MKTMIRPKEMADRMTEGSPGKGGEEDTSGWDFNVYVKPRDPTTTDLGKENYQPVGRCIYCGNTDDLRREHVIPYALGGRMVLQKATCKTCADITSEFEGDVLRGPFRAVRAFRGLGSRSGFSGMPEAEEVTVSGDSEQDSVVEVPREDMPLLLPFPLFAPPGYFSQQTDMSGITVSGMATVRFGPDPGDLVKSLGAKSVNITKDCKPVAFARLLAKVAYGVAFARGQIDKIEGECFVLPAILGTRDDIGCWVGTLTKGFECHPEFLHRADLHIDESRGLLFGEVQIFADSQTPTYGVVLGKLKT